MNIVNILLTNRNGGLEQAFYDYSLLLHQLGHQVIAIVREDAPYIDKISEIGVKIIKIKNNFGYIDLLAIKNLKNIFNQFDADVVFSHAGRSTQLCRKAIKRIKQRKIFQIAVNHSNNIKRSIGCDLIFSINKQIFYRTIDAGQPENRSFVMHNGIEVENISDYFEPVNFDKKPVITLGVIGRIDESKGFDHVVRALDLLRQEAIDYRFLLKIAGSGPYVPYLQSLIKKLDIEPEAVEFLGWIEDKKKFFNEIDIFILPSISEPFGLVILEAMKYKKPIIATCCDGPLEILRHNIEGQLVVREPLTSLHYRIRDSVYKLISNSLETNEMIASAYSRLKQRFSYSALKNNLAEFVGDETKKSKNKNF